MTIDLQPPTSLGARVALAAASGLATAQAHAAMTPEAVLLATLYDEAVHRESLGEVAEELALRRAVLSSDEARNAAGWSERAMKAYSRAWQRAHARGRARSLLGVGLRVVMTSKRLALLPAAKLTIGDLLAGLSGAGTLVDDVLRARGLDPAHFDDEDDPPLPALRAITDADADALPPHARLDVMVLNDDATPMDFVVNTLVTHFDCPQLRAVSLMYRIHHAGRARVHHGTAGDVRRRVSRAREAIAAAGHPLALEYGPRA